MELDHRLWAREILINILMDSLNLVIGIIRDAMWVRYQLVLINSIEEGNYLSFLKVKETNK